MRRTEVAAAARLRAVMAALAATGFLWTGTVTADSAAADTAAADTAAADSAAAGRPAAPRAGEGARPAARRAAPPRIKTVTLGIRHRVFHEFRQVSEVKMREEFPVGDSPYTARVVEFVPDFSLNLDTRKVVSLSNQPKNPAFRVLVREKGVPSDTAWAFLNMPPHFSRNSMLSFQVARIDFADRAPMTSRDSTLLRGVRP